jgi:hypothetical protein
VLPADAALAGRVRTRACLVRVSASQASVQKAHHSQIIMPHAPCHIPCDAATSAARGHVTPGLPSDSHLTSVARHAPPMRVKVTDGSSTRHMKGTCPLGTWLPVHAAAAACSAGSGIGHGYCVKTQYGAVLSSCCASSNRAHWVVHCCHRHQQCPKTCLLTGPALSQSAADAAPCHTSHSCPSRPLTRCHDQPAAPGCSAQPAQSWHCTVLHQPLLQCLGVPLSLLFCSSRACQLLMQNLVAALSRLFFSP